MQPLSNNTHTQAAEFRHHDDDDDDDHDDDDDDDDADDDAVLALAPVYWILGFILSSEFIRLEKHNARI